MNSDKVLACTDGFTTNTSGTVPTMDTGEKLFCTSYVTRPRYKAALMEWLVSAPISKV
ncbi:hypothetical protein D3C80_1891390 [compost metagenome]